MTKHQVLNAVIMLLALVALGLGYLIYQRVITNAPISSTSTTTPNQQSQQTPGSPISCGGVDIKSVLRGSPPKDSSREEKQKYADLIICLAKTGEAIEFDENCEATPAILKAQSFEVNIKNKATQQIKVRSVISTADAATQGEIIHAIGPGETQLFDFKGSSNGLHITSCHVSNALNNPPSDDERKAIILTPEAFNK